jgi:AcrR family transcriptional regulator
VREKGRRRSDAILDAATTLLVDEGYARLSMRRIAARAGIAPGNLQYYYPTKQDVVRALLDRWLARARADAAAAGRERPPEHRLLASLDAVLAEASDANCRLFWDLWALAARDPIVARATRTFYDRYRDAVADALRTVRPTVGRAVAQRRAMLVVALLEGLSVLRIGRPRTGMPDAALRRELRTLVLHLAKEIP